MLTSVLSSLSLLFTLGTLSGVVLHDTRLDKAATILATPVSPTTYEIGNKPLVGGDAHTHVERGSFSQAMKTYQTSTPGMQPRDERKHMLAKHVPKGHHAFDNYNLPLV